MIILSARTSAPLSLTRLFISTPSGEILYSSTPIGQNVEPLMASIRLPSICLRGPSLACISLQCFKIVVPELSELPLFSGNFPNCSAHDRKQWRIMMRIWTRQRETSYVVLARLFAVWPALLAKLKKSLHTRLRVSPSLGTCFASLIPNQFLHQLHCYSGHIAIVVRRRPAMTMLRN